MMCRSWNLHNKGHNSQQFGPHPPLFSQDQRRSAEPVLSSLILFVELEAVPLTLLSKAMNHSPVLILCSISDASYNS